MPFSACCRPALLFVRTLSIICTACRKDDPKLLPDIFVFQTTDETRRDASGHDIIVQIMNHRSARAHRHSMPNTKPRQHGTPQPEKALLTDANATAQQHARRQMRIVLQDTVVPNDATHADEASRTESRQS